MGGVLLAAGRAAEPEADPLAAAHHVEDHVDLLVVGELAAAGDAGPVPAPLLRLIAVATADADEPAERAERITVDRTDTGHGAHGADLVPDDLACQFDVHDAARFRRCCLAAGHVTKWLRYRFVLPYRCRTPTARRTNWTPSSVSVASSSRTSTTSR